MVISAVATGNVATVMAVVVAKAGAKAVVTGGGRWHGRRKVDRGHSRNVDWG